MNFHDQAILITGAGKAARDIAERILSDGARTVVLVGEAPGGESGQAGLAWIAEDALDGPGQSAAAAGINHIDVVINLTDLSHDRAVAGGEAAAGAGGALDAAQDIVARTSRVVHATRDLLDRNPAGGAIVNLCCVTRTQVTASAAASVAGSLKTVTEALALQLAPRIRVNGVLSELDGEDVSDHSFGPALFLASSAARHITGTVLTADDGRRLGFAALAKPDAPVGNTLNG